MGLREWGEKHRVWRSRCKGRTWIWKHIGWCIRWRRGERKCRWRGSENAEEENAGEQLVGSWGCQQGGIWWGGPSEECRRSPTWGACRGAGNKEGFCPQAEALFSEVMMMMVMKIRSRRRRLNLYNCFCGDTSISPCLLGGGWIISGVSWTHASW